MSNVNLSIGVFVHVCAYTYVCGLSMEVFMYIWAYLPMCPHIMRVFLSLYMSVPMGLFVKYMSTCICVGVTVHLVCLCRLCLWACVFKHI